VTLLDRCGHQQTRPELARFSGQCGQLQDAHLGGMDITSHREASHSRNLKSGEWAVVIGLLLLAWAVRLWGIEAVPPGWRDDELINACVLSGEVLGGSYPLYFTGASGHEPLYHYLHAALIAAAGMNALTGRLLSVMFGTTTIAGTYVLGRRLFGRAVGLISAATLSVSFWSLMYSRFALRHVSLPLLALVAFYWVCRLCLYRSGPGSRRQSLLQFSGVGLVAGVALYTYPAARLLPAVFLLFGAYLAAFHRATFERSWRGLLASLVVALVLAVPLGVAIVHGRSDAGTEGIGADARLAELAKPLRQLLAGNPRPIVQNVSVTLGMFHATGDPEWLYNIAGRPVFNLPGGVLFWLGVVACIVLWKRPQFFFLLAWFGLALLPTFLSVPGASLSHSILAQPLAYLFAAIAITAAVRGFGRLKLSGAGGRAVRVALVAALAGSVVANVARDLYDYFVQWPQDDRVQFLYRGDYRKLADYLDDLSGISDMSVSSPLMGPWDRLALEIDVPRPDLSIRLYNPERALVWDTGGADSAVMLSTWPRPSVRIQEILDRGTLSSQPISSRWTLFMFRDALLAPSTEARQRFDIGLQLLGLQWSKPGSTTGSDEVAVIAYWEVSEPLDLPPMPIVANPPPPGVYSGPRLSVFAHLMANDGEAVGIDDGLWVDPVTLRPGDRFAQEHSFAIPADNADGRYALEIGLYDPLTGERWRVQGTAAHLAGDRLLFEVPEEALE
jgi:4-amino-4-deoxy-L-arabinose transferase-like glycosyltransferase